MQAQGLRMKFYNLIGLNVSAIILMVWVASVATPNKFLIWNLFLALIPLNLSYLFVFLKQKQAPVLLLGVVGLIWLFFYPNTIYMITDYLHLVATGVDLVAGVQVINYVLLSAGIFLGVLFGLESAYQMQQAMLGNAPKLLSIGYYGGLAVLTSFGIYLGRYLRLNSWHIFTEPVRVLRAVEYSVMNDVHFTVMFMIWFTALQLILFAVYYCLKRG